MGGLTLIGIFIGYKFYKRGQTIKKNPSSSIDAAAKPCKKWSTNVCIKAPCPQTCIEQ